MTNSTSTTASLGRQEPPPGRKVPRGSLGAARSSQAGGDRTDPTRRAVSPRVPPARLRLAFVVAAGQTSADWSNLTLADIQADPQELRARLLPLLRRRHVPGVKDIDAWINRLVEETRQLMSVVLPLRPDERAFLAEINERGRIEPELLTEDIELAERITLNPGLRWKALNVRRHRGIGD